MPKTPNANRTIYHKAGTATGASTDILTTSDVTGPIVVHAYHLTPDGAGTVDVKNGSTSLTGAKTTVAGLPIHREDSPQGVEGFRPGLMRTDGVNPLSIALTGGITVAYEFEYSAGGGNIDG